MTYNCVYILLRQSVCFLNGVVDGQGSHRCSLFFYQDLSWVLGGELHMHTVENLCKTWLTVGVQGKTEETEDGALTVLAETNE